MVSGLRVQGLARFGMAMYLGVSHTGVEGRVRVGSERINRIRELWV